MTIAKRRVSKMTISMTKRINTVSKTVSSIRMVESISISFRFGIVMTLSGLLGVPAGSYFSQMIRHKTPNADPIVCAVTLLCSVPVLFFGFVSANYSISLCYGLTFLAGLLLN